jgi:hypothetical protein
MKRTPSGEYSEEETIARAEAALKRMLATPYQPHKEMKLGKRKAKESLTANPPKKPR